ncbi:MAG TPA: transposase [Anaerolineales bacterium]|nr:transposase [Anaerolineales bacterium]
MPVKPNFNPDYLYFVTTKAVKHMHLFRRDVIKRIIVDSFHYLRTEGQMKLFAFIIMPNHIHLIALFSKEHTLCDVMRDFKKFTARQIYRQFQAEENMKVLDVLKKEGESLKQKYKVWEDGYDARDVYSTDFLQQKMDYIHHNPCQPQWKLVETAEEYLWSTAGFYIAGKPCMIPVDDVREFLAGSKF